MEEKIDTKILLERLDTQGQRQDDMREQLDRDRSSIDQITLDLDGVKKGQEKILNQMSDFKAEIRQIVLDAIKQEVPKAVKKAVAKELTTISLQNPKKAFERQVGLLETIIKIFKKK